MFHEVSSLKERKVISYLVGIIQRNRSHVLLGNYNIEQGEKKPHEKGLCATHSVLDAQITGSRTDTL